MNTLTWIHISCYHWKKEFRIVFQYNFLLTHLSCWELQSNFLLRLKKKHTGRKLHQHRAELNRFSKPTEVPRTQVPKINYKNISNTCLSGLFLNSVSLPFPRNQCWSWWGPKSHFVSFYIELKRMTQYRLLVAWFPYLNFTFLKHVHISAQCCTAISLHEHTKIYSVHCSWDLNSFWFEQLDFHQWITHLGEHLAISLAHPV